MSAGARITVAIVTAFSAAAFVVIGASLGAELPAGSWPSYGLAMFCALVAHACLVPGARPVTLRLIGFVIFLAYVVYAFDSIGERTFFRAIGGLIFWGLPALYVGIWGKYPVWGPASAAFRSETADRDQPDA